MQVQSPASPGKGNVKNLHPRPQGAADSLSSLSPSQAYIGLQVETDKEVTRGNESIITLLDQEVRCSQTRLYSAGWTNRKGILLGRGGEWLCWQRKSQETPSKPLT